MSFVFSFYSDNFLFVYLTAVVNNRLEELTRRPCDLRKYLAWSTNIKARYGSITNFVVQERLQWEPLLSEGPPSFLFNNQVPFADSHDFEILRNDWPYGVSSEITHLCVWTKSPIATDLTNGDMTPESRRIIENFVSNTFAKPLDALFGKGQGRENVLWFKNPVVLQSVRGVDHIHVLLRNVPKHLVDEWTT